VIDPLTFFGHLHWLDGRPLLDTIEDYRGRILGEALFTFEPDGRPRYNLVLRGRAKKNWNSLPNFPPLPRHEPNGVRNSLPLPIRRAGGDVLMGDCDQQESSVDKGLHLISPRTATHITAQVIDASYDHP
jgi:hypothetical protein